MATVAGAEIAGSGIAGTFLRDAPTVTITAPTGPVSDSTVDVEWTYLSTVGRAQASYRVRLFTPSLGTTLYDSGTITGADTTFACPFLLSGGSSYVVRVSLSDGVDTGDGDASFSYSSSSVASFGDVDSVGSVYEVAINGVGYVLADTPQRPYRRSSGALQAPRFATGDTPFSQAVERYSFVGSGDWSRGAGQRLMDRQDSDPRAFWDSEGLDVFTPGQLSLLNETTQQRASTQATVRAAVASGALLVQTDDSELTRQTAVDGAGTAMSFGSDVVTDLASDGVYWYAAADSVEIFRGSSTTVGAAWSDLSTQTTAIDLIEWASDRLAVAYTDASSQACLSTLTPAGAEETAGGRFKHQDATITAITAGDGYVWYSVNRQDRSQVWAWQLGSSDASFLALELPQGQSVTGLYFYLGNIMVRAEQDLGAVIYRTVPSSGELTPERLLTIDGAGNGPGDFVGSDRFVFFSWTAMSAGGASGVGAIDLATGGYAKWFAAPSDSAAGDVTSLFVWEGRVGFTVDSYGAVLEGTDPVASGYLESSTSDMGSALTKVVDRAELIADPLPSGGAVVLAFSPDGGATFTTFGSLSTPGAQTGQWELGQEGQAGTSRLTITATTTSPVVQLLQFQVHALTLVDQVLELPIDCSERRVGLNGVEIQDGQPTGLARARVLESLSGSRVRLQDVDWPTTRVAEVWEVVATELTSTGTFDRNRGVRVAQDAVCVVTLRRGS